MFIELYRAIDDIADYMAAQGIPLPECYKRRDTKEPGRAEKEQFEDKLTRLIKRRFNTQKDIIAESLRWSLPQKSEDDWLNRIPDLSDPVTEKRIFNLFIGGLHKGQQLFAYNIGFDVDWTQYDEEASKWARTYLHEKMDDGLQGFFDSLDETTMGNLKQELANFVEVEGYTLADVTRGLSDNFESRAQRIAVTETTRVFAEADDIAGKLVEEEYPDIRVIKTWFTNNDDIVRRCPICWPMHGISVLRSERFPNGLDGPPGHVNCRCWRQTMTDVTGSVPLG